MENCYRTLTQQDRQIHSGEKFYGILYDSILSEISRAFSSLKYDWLYVGYDKERLGEFVADMKGEIEKVIEREEQGFCFKIPCSERTNESGIETLGRPYSSKQLLTAPFPHEELE